MATKGTKRASSSRIARKEVSVPAARTSDKMSEKEFILTAIVRLRNAGHKGVHTVFSGLNEAFRDYYGKDADPVAAQQRLAAEGHIVIMPAHRGVLLYKKGDEPNLQSRGKGNKTSRVLEKILA